MRRERGRKQLVWKGPRINMLFRRRRADLIADPPGRALLLFAFPIFLGNLFQQFYNMVD